MVEDHPIDYGDFEGVIPRDNYGAGEVIVWDRGVYTVIDPPNGDAAEAVRNGKLDIELRGFKVRGAFTLVRTQMKAERQGSQAELAADQEARSIRRRRRSDRAFIRVQSFPG